MKRRRRGGRRRRKPYQINLDDVLNRCAHEGGVLMSWGRWNRKKVPFREEIVADEQLGYKQDDKGG
jgi:hypothetical protein